MTSAGSQALLQSLALLKTPAAPRPGLRERLPDGMLWLLRIAAGDEQAIARARQETGEPAETLREAAVFYIQQVMFAIGGHSYRLLGVDPDASDERIKEHYRWLVRWLHPDRNPDEWEAVYADRVNRAWQDLRSRERRARFDAQRADEAAPPAPAPPHAVMRPFPVQGAASADFPRVGGRRWVHWLPKLVFGGLGVATVLAVGLLYVLRAPPSPTPPPVPVAVAPTTDAGTPAPVPAAASAPAAGPMRPAGANSDSARAAGPEAIAAVAREAPPEPIAAESEHRRVAATPAAPPPTALPVPPAAAGQPRSPAIAAAPRARPSAGPASSPVAAGPHAMPAHTGTRRERPVPPPPSPVTEPAPRALVRAVPETASLAVPSARLPDPAIAPSPARDTRLDDPTANGLLGAFSRAYNAGDLDSLRQLLTDDARGNDGKLLPQYRRLFARTAQRSLNVRDVSWLQDGPTASIIATYEAAVSDRADSVPRRSEGDLRMDLRIENGQWRIYRLRHDDRRG